MGSPSCQRPYIGKGQFSLTTFNIGISAINLPWTPIGLLALSSHQLHHIVSLLLAEMPARMWHCFTHVHELQVTFSPRKYISLLCISIKHLLIGGYSIQVHYVVVV